jgi:hypothetical protein
MALLDLSKQHTYKLFYDVLKPKYGNTMELLDTDTDRFVSYTETDDMYEDSNDFLFKGYGYSDEAKEHKNYDTSNKNKFGFFKDDVYGSTRIEFIGLQPTMYAFKLDDGNDEKKAEGILKPVVQKEIHFTMNKKH